MCEIFFESIIEKKLDLTNYMSLCVVLLLAIDGVIAFAQFLVGQTVFPPMNKPEYCPPEDL